jgi:hypothetical protein
MSVAVRSLIVYQTIVGAITLSVWECAPYQVASATDTAHLFCAAINHSQHKRYSLGMEVRKRLALSFEIHNQATDELIDGNYA